MLTMGWSGDQRRALVAALDDRQVTLVRGRIALERSERRIEEGEAREAAQFLNSRGTRGHSWGVPEWAAAVLFGADPAFRKRWQAIRRMHDEENCDG